MQVSGLLAMVVAGIITGNKARDEAMSINSRDYLSKFWKLIDELMNAILFLLIGLQMLIVPINTTLLMLGFFCIMIVLLSRWISVAFPVLLLRKRVTFEKGAVGILTWGGLRGGISVALAQSLPADMGYHLFVPATYMVVVFFIF